MNLPGSCWQLTLLAVFLPGDPAMGEAVRGWDGRRSAVLLANNGLMVAGHDQQAAANAPDEFEVTANLVLPARCPVPRMPDAAQIEVVLRKPAEEWE